MTSNAEQTSDHRVLQRKLIACQQEKAALEARLAAEVQQVAIAREREQAAQARLAELAKANEALQQTTDALGGVSDFDEFVPAVLKIVARAFGTTACGYYEHFEAEPIYLRYWFSNDRVLNPMELQLLDPEVYPALRRLAYGFTVAPAYLHGTTVRGRTHPAVLDHRTMTVTPELHAFAVAQGWEFELNQPLMVNGQAEGAIVIYRPAHQSFTDREVALAETLAKPLALALQAQRLATQTREQAVEAAIAREREQAAQARAAELARANATMRRCLSWLAQEGDLNRFLKQVLLEIASTVQADIAYLFVLHKPDRMLEVIARVIDGQPSEQGTPTEPAIFSAPFSADITPAFRLMEEQNLFLTLDICMLQPELREIMWPDTIDWHRREGRQRVGSLVLKAGDRSVVFLGLGFREPGDFSEEERELVVALANQAALALELTRLAEEAKQAAIAREQEQAVQSRAAELARANEVLRRTASRLVELPNLNHFLESVLLEAARESGAVNNSVFFYSRQSNTLLMQSAVQDGEVVNLETDSRFEIWRTPISADISEGWEQVRSRGYVCHDFEGELGVTWDISVPWHQMMGHRFVMSVFLQVGDEPLGFMALCFRERVQLSAERLELIQALANQAALAIQLTRLAEEAKQAAILSERNRMAREIHDSLAQVFTSILVRLQTAQLALQDNPTEAQNYLEQTSNLARQGLGEARRSVHALRPQVLEGGDLAGAISHCLHQITHGTSVQGSFHQTGQSYRLPEQLQLELFRIGQEAITNACKHAHPTKIQVELSFLPQRIQLAIQDSGQGFILADPSQSKGFGLIGMHERAQIIGGELTISSQPQQGTQVLVTVEVAPPNRRSL